MTKASCPSLSEFKIPQGIANRLVRTRRGRIRRYSHSEVIRPQILKISTNLGGLGHRRPRPELMDPPRTNSKDGSHKSSATVKERRQDNCDQARRGGTYQATSYSRVRPDGGGRGTISGCRRSSRLLVKQNRNKTNVQIFPLSKNMISPLRYVIVSYFVQIAAKLTNGPFRFPLTVVVVRPDGVKPR